MGKDINDPKPGPKYDTTSKPYSYQGNIKTSFAQDKRIYGFARKESTPAPGTYDQIKLKSIKGQKFQKEVRNPNFMKYSAGMEAVVEKGLK